MAICLFCNQPFVPIPWSKGLYCSLKCWYSVPRGGKFTCKACLKPSRSSQSNPCRGGYCSAECARRKHRMSTSPPPSVPGTAWIVLTRGKFALVDESDFKSLDRFVWEATKDGVVRNIYGGRGCPQRREAMHRRIMQVDDEEILVDHRNGDRFDNRRQNLRVATTAQNSANRQKSLRRASSKFKGVWWGANIKRWQASIGSPPNRRFLGCFTDEEAAARAYDAAARDIFGEFAALNFPKLPGERSALG